MITAADLLGAAAIPELLNRIHPVRPEAVRVYPAPALMRKLWAKGIAAMTIGSRVFVKPDLLENPGPALGFLIVHELVHVHQWRRQSHLRFFGNYSMQYLMARLWGAPHFTAYLSVAAEVEARRVTAEIRRSVNNQAV